jgi:hypothetical protein
VVAMNPFKEMPRLYDRECMDQYHANPKGLPPHIYNTAELALRTMKRLKKYVMPVLILVLTLQIASDYNLRGEWCRQDGDHEAFATLLYDCVRGLQSLCVNLFGSVFFFLVIFF